MSREALIRETLRLPWTDVLSGELQPTKVIVAGAPEDTVGVVVPLRGRWWGMTVVRCDSAIAHEIAAKSPDDRYGAFDRALRWLGLELAKAVRRTVDLTAELGDAIVLAGAEAMWSPKNGKLFTEAAFTCGGRSLVVSAYERLRSDRRSIVIESGSLRTRDAVPNALLDADEIGEIEVSVVSPSTITGALGRTRGTV